MSVFSRFCNVYDSSNIAQVAYDLEGNRLGVSFRQPKGDIIKYVYEDVPIEIFGLIVSAKSVGKEFNKHKLKGTKIA